MLARKQITSKACLTVLQNVAKVNPEFWEAFGENKRVCLTVMRQGARKSREVVSLGCKHGQACPL